MSDLRFATADALLAWLRDLAGERRVVAPRREGPSVLFRPIPPEEMTELEPMLRRSTVSPKAAILPASEVLFRFASAKDADDPSRLATTLDVPADAAPTVLFGGRPCDARGFVTLDRPYLEGPHQDPYYAARRAATVIVTQACPSAFPVCFCNWVGSGPADPEGSDIVFTALATEDGKGGFALEALTDKGRELLGRLSCTAFHGDLASAVSAAREAAQETLPPPSALENIPAAVLARFTDEDFWRHETAKCLSCGACTYVCPTCQCFTITDEGSALDGRRLRSWDSCMKPQFTLETSGHNPRPDKAKRMRNRIGHKFGYYPQNYGGAYSCCGCGRCVASCPVSLDIRHMVAAAVQGAEKATDKPAPQKKAKAPAKETS